MGNQNTQGKPPSHLRQKTLLTSEVVAKGSEGSVVEELCSYPWALQLSEDYGRTGVT